MKTFLDNLQKKWGYASLSYFVLCAAQMSLGSSITTALSLLLASLSCFSFLFGFAHKGATFEQARANSKSLFRLPWPQKYSHMAVCAATMILSAILIAGNLMRTPELAYVGVLLAAISGWLASLDPLPDQSASGGQSAKK